MPNEPETMHAQIERLARLNERYEMDAEYRELCVRLTKAAERLGLKERLPASIITTLETRAEEFLVNRVFSPSERSWRNIVRTRDCWVFEDEM